MEDFIQVFTTTEKKEDAERIARALVEGRLAACVQIAGPVTSTFWWMGKVETAEEWVCCIKSRKAIYGKIEKAIRGLHPYETPEIIATPITAGSRDFLEWVRSEVRQPLQA